MSLNTKDPPTGPRLNEKRARFVLSRCLPMKVKAPPLNGKDGAVAIEELQIAYERITVKKGN